MDYIMRKTEAAMEAALESRLRPLFPAADGRLSIERIPGGQSNPTFFLTLGDRRLVLRKQPPNALPSAHAVDREFRIMAALADSGLPVPEMLFFCDDPSVIGTPFYLMERVEGRVFGDPALPGVAPDERLAIYMAMADTLARLHGIDWAALGLADFGRHGDYFERQVARWSRQWELSKRAGSPDIDFLLDWLPRHIPSDARTTIVHGDFRIGNLMFHPHRPEVVAILDWELSTLGHPAADVAYSALGWHLHADDIMGFADRDFGALGIPPEAAYLERYAAAADAEFAVEPFHFAFSLFRLAVISEGIAARARLGTAAADNALEMGRLTARFARLAVQETG